MQVTEREKKEKQETKHKGIIRILDAERGYLIFIWCMWKLTPC